MVSKIQGSREGHTTKGETDRSIEIVRKGKIVVWAEGH